MELAKKIANATPTQASRALSILHIANDYCHQALYKCFCESLQNLNHNQVIFTPARKIDDINKNKIDDAPNIRHHYSDRFKPIYRIMFRSRIRALYDDIIKNNLQHSIDIIHAHTLFADGAIALKLHKRFDIPYIVAVRNSDLNHYFNYRKDLHRIGFEILKHAKKIITLTPDYHEKLLQRLPKAIIAEIQNKIQTIPNGINPFWLENQTPATKICQKLKVLSVNDLSPNKNNIRLAKAIANLSHNVNISLTIVGANNNGPNTRAIIKLFKHNPQAIEVLPRTTDKTELLNIYRDHNIFAMPSLRESFGLVFIEALSQGLPILSTKGEGVSSYFQNKNYCKAVNPKSIHEIKDAILNLHENQTLLANQPINLNQFDWNTIAREYERVYTIAISNNN